MRKKLLRISSWLQLTLVIAVLIPLFYGLIFPPEEVFGGSLYIKSLLILFPIIATDVAVKKIKTLGGYLLVCAGILSVTGAAARLIGPVLGQESRLWAYVVLLLAEAFVLMVSRFSVRMKKMEEYDAMQASGGEGMTFAQFFREKQSILDKPQLQFLGVFPVIYGVGWLLYNSSLCNSALFGAVCYFFLYLLYNYLEKTEEYLSLNQRVAGVPKKRIYGIGKTMFLLFIAVLVLGMLPGFLTVKYRKYQNLREWEIVFSEYVDELDEDDKKTFTPQKKSYSVLGYREVPEWLSYFSYAAGAACCLIFLFVMIVVIRQVFADFRGGSEENGDIVENLTKMPEEEIEQISIGKKRYVDKEKESVRKKYRRAIKRHRKDLPNPAETPAEIEERAGLSEDVAMKELHVQYERARYGIRKKEGSWR